MTDAPNLDELRAFMARTGSPGDQSPLPCSCGDVPTFYIDQFAGHSPHWFTSCENEKCTAVPYVAVLGNTLAETVTQWNQAVTGEHDLVRHLRANARGESK